MDHDRRPRGILGQSTLAILPEVDLMSRCFVAALCLTSLLIGAGCGDSKGVSTTSDLQTQDYAEVRRTFQTKLLRAGPSPQPVDEEARIPARVEKITYKSGELELAAYVDGAPPEAGKRPALLFLHGGFAFGGDDLEMPQPYRDAGFVVMVPILRGEHSQPGNFTLFFDEVDDVLASATALAELSYVDAARLFVAGHSAGGTLAMLATMTSDRFVRGASLSGSCNQLNQDPSLTPFDRSSIREFEMRSPVVFAHSFKSP